MDKIIYVVSGYPAGGTSMMMKVLIDGGIEGVYRKVKEPQKFINNPHGVFEGEWQEKNPEELIGKVVKGLGISWRKIPEDYKIKMIRIEREQEEVAKSRLRRRQRKREFGLKIPETTEEEMLVKIKKMKDNYDEKFNERKNIERIIIKFDDMFLDTKNQCERIKDFVKPLVFDCEKALKAVDKTLDHGDKTTYLNERRLIK